MGLFDNFPYTNFHELNLNWILSKLGLLDESKEAAKQAATEAANSANEAAGQVASAQAAAEAAAQSADEAQAYATTGDRYVIIGDSYGIGYNPDDPNSPFTAWPTIAKNLLGVADGNWYVSCEGGAGFSNPGNHTGKTFSGLLQSVVAESPETITKIIVVGGYNDKGYNSNTLTNAIDLFCQGAKTKFPKASVYVGFVGRSVSESKSMSTVNGLYTAGTIYKTQKSAFYLTGVELAARRISFFANDGFHPNGEGQKAIGYAVAQAVKTGAYSPNLEYINIGLTGGDGDATFKATVGQIGDMLAFYCPRTVITRLSNSGKLDGKTPVVLGKITEGPMVTPMQTVNFRLTGSVVCDQGFVPCDIGLAIDTNNVMKAVVRAFKPDGSEWATNMTQLKIEANTVVVPAVYY